MVILPGGFSGGDEPDGSAKFIASFFRNPEVTEAVRRLLQQRDGLMLGICNGFQALIKLGLVPYGDIRPITPYDPTLTFNTIGRHQSMLVRTRIASTGSPWLSKCEVGEQFTVAISHGEGRFVAPQEVLDTLMKNGQIATQYLDIEARLDNLTAQRTRLQELQASADALSDLLQIESSLSDVQYQIESYQSQLNWYANQVVRKAL